MTRLLGLDPGLSTGWALFHYDATTPLTLLDYGEILGGHQGVIAFWKTMPEPDEVVAETFRLDGRTIYPEVDPLRTEGALSVLHPGWIGQPNTAKIMADDILLKRLGWWLKGKPHARDAARHAIALMKSRRHLPTLSRISPPR